MELNIIRLEYEFNGDTGSCATALHSVLKTFEGRFKAHVCRRVQGACADCPEAVECAFVAVFAQRLSDDSEIVRIHQKPSLPFAFSFLQSGGAAGYDAIGLVVTGSATTYISEFHAVMLDMLGQVLANVPSLATGINSYSLDYFGIRQSLPASGDISGALNVLSAQYILNSAVESDTVCIKLFSPLRLPVNGVILNHFDFARFCRSQLRRCSSLWAYYGSGTLPLDFIAISRAAESVALLEEKMHYGRSQLRTWSSSGLTGSVECCGLVEPMVALLQLGSYFNAGKGAAYGFGCYRLEEMG